MGLEMEHLCVELAMLMDRLIVAMKLEVRRGERERERERERETIETLSLYYSPLWATHGYKNRILGIW